MQFKRETAQSDTKGQSSAEEALPVTKDQIATPKQSRLGESLHNESTPLREQSARPSTADKGRGPEDGLFIAKDRLRWLDEILDLVEPGLGISWTEEDGLARGNEGRQRRMLTIHTQLEIDTRKRNETRVRKQQDQHKIQRKKREAARKLTIEAISALVGPVQAIGESNDVLVIGSREVHPDTPLDSLSRDERVQVEAARKADRLRRERERDEQLVQQWYQRSNWTRSGRSVRGC